MDVTVMNMRLYGGFWDVYKGKECVNPFQDEHIFSENKNCYLCECGFKKRNKCTCAECGSWHDRIIDTTAEERTEHEIVRLHSMLQALKPPTEVKQEKEADIVQ
jgi:hypothetical protein